MGKILDLLTAQKVPLSLDQKKQILAFDRELEEMEAKVTTLQTETLHLRAKVNPLEREVERLKQQVQQQGSVAGIQSGNPDRYVCDHCGSPRLKRTGNRPNETFGVLGVKDAVFICADCGKESAFMPEPKRR